jgi:hypothetical protein
MKTRMMGLLALAVAARLNSAGRRSFSADGGNENRSDDRKPMEGKKVAYLGDSITDKRHVGTTSNYWQYLDSYLGTEAGFTVSTVPIGTVFRSGAETEGGERRFRRRDHRFRRYERLQRRCSARRLVVDDEPARRMLGQKMEVRARRLPNLNQGTFRGRINVVLDYLKTNFPRQQIILLTPIHRGYATFGGGNIQPEESYPNARGLYIGDYVDAVKEAANVWAVPVIDLNSASGLYPLNPEHLRYFHDVKTDRLHPNAAGQRAWPAPSLITPRLSAISNKDTRKNNIAILSLTRHRGTRRKLCELMCAL